uniref:Uncharacterized protein n=1 Tax=Physcomitrium patens TaxID=3218 RepID=A0A2K1KXE4_PHYPA|nr:hypothetical protein PHYPA_005436 [Physcomitrium patens]
MNIVLRFGNLPTSFTGLVIRVNPPVASR